MWGKIPHWGITSFDRRPCVRGSPNPLFPAVAGLERLTHSEAQSLDLSCRTV